MQIRDSIIFWLGMLAGGACVAMGGYISYRRDKRR